MKKTFTYILLTLFATGFISCNKNELEKNGGNNISFDVKDGGTVMESSQTTKAERYNSESDFAGQTFGLYAWNSSVSNTVVYSNESVSKVEGKWKPATNKSWEDRDSYVFEAVYPKPAASLGTVGLTSLTTDSDPAKLKFSYKIPTATMTAEDKDFMLAYYSGYGDQGVAPLTFTHPLTCVNFKAGTLTGVTTINSITVCGVYASGECSVLPATYGEDGRQCYAYEKTDDAHTSLWTPAGETSVTGTSQISASTLAANTWTYNFLLIPQDTKTKNVEIKINITNEAGDTYNVKTTIKTDYWRAGYANTYTVNYAAGAGLTLDPVHVTPWDTIEKAINIYDKYTIIAEPVSSAVSYTGGDFQIKVTSFSSEDGGTTSSKEAWTMEYSQDGESWTTNRPQMITSDVSGEGSTSASIASIPVGAQTGTDVEDVEFEALHTAALKNATPKIDYDLSLYNPATGEYRISQNTANCYIVNSVGSYKFPLVYGNAIKNNEVNTIAFAPEKESTTLPLPLLKEFVNCKDKAISSPYIRTDIDALEGSDAISGDYSAALLWQDVKGLIEPSGFGVDGNYITFKVSAENIHQGNAIIALKKGETIVWSWHIWVTDEDMTKDNVFVNAAKNEYKFMSVNLGQIDKGNIRGAKHYAPRSYFVRVVQTASGKRSNAIEVIQAEEVTGSTRTNASTSLTYQWGRKDALFCENDSNTAFDINGNTVTAYYGVDYRLTPYNTTLGNLILNPVATFYINNDYQSPTLINYANLWNNGEINGTNHIYDIPVIKTIYDPCPVGFYVPSITTFKTLSSDGTAFNNGWSYIMKDGNSLHFPANGIRNPFFNQGFAWMVNGIGAYYYSCTANLVMNPYGNFGQTHIFYLDNGTAVKTDAYCDRAMGCSIRPVKEK